MIRTKVMELTLNWNLLNRWKLALCLDLIRVKGKSDISTHETDPLEDEDLRRLLTARDQHLLRDIGLDQSDTISPRLYLDQERKRLDPYGMPWW